MPDQQIKIPEEIVNFRISSTPIFPLNSKTNARDRSAAKLLHKVILDNRENARGQLANWLIAKIANKEIKRVIDLLRMHDSIIRKKNRTY